MAILNVLNTLNEWLLPENHRGTTLQARAEEMKHLRNIMNSLKRLCRKSNHKFYKFIFAATKALEHAMKEHYDKYLNEMKSAISLDLPWGYRIQILNRMFRVRKVLMERQSGSVINGADLDKVWNMNITDDILKQEDGKTGRGYTRNDARELFSSNETLWELKMMDI